MDMGRAIRRLRGSLVRVGEHVSEEVIEAVAAEVQADGLYDWAPKKGIYISDYAPAS